jgi:uncharacterized alkaline shock family protein YloU
MLSINNGASCTEPPLPEVTSGIQKELKSHLETITGLTIHEIGVLVDNNKDSYSGKANQ